jgi:RND superfamily putative drug exporter
LLAAPFLSVRFGFPDAGNNRAETSTRQAYDMTSAGFGAGANGPLVLVAELPPGASLAPVEARLNSTDGVATVLPPQFNQARDTAMLTVLPKYGPQDPRTEDLVRQLRDSTLPAANAGTDVDISVGGIVARSIDSNENIATRIPLLIGGVVLLSMLLLLFAFRSIAVAVKAAAMNLLSVAAAYGVISLVLQGGWVGQLIGIDTPTPLPAFVPVLMFAVLFGLSMDYEVFLVSRTREAWLRSGDNSRAVTEGLAGTGRVITAAAAIMVAVFAAFIPSADIVLKLLGVGMSAAILFDATVIRMLLVPAVMQMLGRANWWMPGGLSRIMPELHVEGRPEIYLPHQEHQLTKV